VVLFSNCRPICDSAIAQSSGDFPRKRQVAHGSAPLDQIIIVAQAVVSVFFCHVKPAEATKYNVKRCCPIETGACSTQECLFLVATDQF
jgi:hypothetical protein